ncbi:hypothetical protein ACPCXF_11245 [Lysinibacillus agricola]
MADKYYNEIQKQNEDNNNTKSVKEDLEISFEEILNKLSKKEGISLELLKCDTELIQEVLNSNSLTKEEMKVLKAELGIK